MNKLGFAIKLASQGAGNAIECNKGQWTNKVVDIREYLKLFNGLQGTDNIVTFISFDESGCFVTQLRAISGRVGDFLSGWIYIPNTIEASGQDIMNAYNFVKNILSQSNLNDCLGDIDSFFSKEYPVKEVVAHYLPSNGEEFGVRFLGVPYSLKEILDTNRYQPCYSKFRVIFLLEKEGDVKITKEQVSRFKDLTKFPIESTCAFKAPSPEIMRSLGQGVKIVFQNRQEFKNSILVKQGSSVQLFAIREGFEPIALPTVKVLKDGQVLSIDRSQLKWMKKITPSMFSIFNRKQEKIEKGVRISINGADISFKEALISEVDCQNALIKVSAPDYETFEERRNLLLGTLTITLARKVRAVQATIELSNGHLGEMTLESKYITGSKFESPINGYTYEEDDYGHNVLRLSSWFIWKQRLFGFLGGLGVLALIVLALLLKSWIDAGFPMPWDDTPKASVTTITPPVTSVGEKVGDDAKEKEQEKTYTIEDAIKYLDSSLNWSKKNLDLYPDLIGLFEDLNNFELSSLLGKWNNKLSGSKNFLTIRNSAKKTIGSGWKPKQGQHNPTWNKEGVYIINIQNYANWLAQDQTPKPKPANVVKPKPSTTSQPSPSKGKDAKTRGSKNGDL